MNYTLIYTFKNTLTDSLEQISISGYTMKSIENIWNLVDKTNICNVTVRRFYSQD